MAVPYTHLIETRLSRLTKTEWTLPMPKTFTLNGFANAVLAATPLLAVLLAVYTQAFGQV